MKKINLKAKIINQIMKKGNKKTSEKLLFKSFKNLYKNSKKQVKKIIQMSVINTMPLFKIHKISNKKVKKKKNRVKIIPSFISKLPYRTSLSIKVMLKDVKTKTKFHNEFTKKLLSAFDNKPILINQKDEMKQNILSKTWYLRSYRW